MTIPDHDETGDAPVFSETPEVGESAPISIKERGSPWKACVPLLFASMLGTLAILPFSASLLKQFQGPKPPEALLVAVLIISAVVEFAISAVAIALGLGLGHRVGLGVPASSRPDPPRPGLRAPLLLATGLGIAAGLFALGLGAVLSSSLQEPPRKVILPPPWECFLASIGAAIREEVWLRLGLMTLLAWIIAKIAGRDRPGTAGVWAANALAAFVFAAIHVPQALALFGASAPLMLFVLIGNGVPGMVFGWLFWRRGLMAAMVAHFWLDIVLKLVAPLFGAS